MELNGEAPMPDYRWEDELDGRDHDGRGDTMPSTDSLLDPPLEE